MTPCNSLCRFPALLLFCLFSFNIAHCQIDWAWSRDGGNNGDFSCIYGTCGDAQGNVYVTGSVSPNAIVGGQPLTLFGTMDIYIAKYSSTGQLIWKRTAGGTSQDIGKRISVDNSGHLYVCGYFSGTAQFGTISVTGPAGPPFFLAKMDTAGNYIWVKAGSCNSSMYYDAFFGLQADDHNNVYLSMNMGANMTMIGSVTNPNFATVPAIVKLNGNGDVIWHYIKNTNGATALSSGFCSSNLKLDKQGKVVLASPIYRGVSTIYTNLFIAKLDTGGNLLWEREVGDSTMMQWGCSPASLDFDDLNNIYIGGNFNTKFCLQQGNPVGSGAFLAKFTPSGNTIWAKKMQTTSNNTASVFDIRHIPNSDSLYLTGYYRGSTDFGGISLNTDFCVRSFIAGYDTSGSINWVNAYGKDSSGLVTRAFCATLSGSAYVFGGGYARNIDLASHTLSYSSAAMYTNNFFIAATKPLQALNIPVSLTNRTFDVVVYPNPASRAVRVQMSLLGSYSVDVYSVTGQLMSGFTGLKDVVDIDTDKWPGGNYYVKVSDGENTIIRKIVVAH